MAEVLTAGARVPMLLVHVGRPSVARRTTWVSTWVTSGVSSRVSRVAVIVVDVLAWELVIAGVWPRLPHHGVWSAGAPVWQRILLTPRVIWPTSLHHWRKIVPRLPPDHPAPAPRGAAGPQTIAPGHTRPPARPHRGPLPPHHLIPPHYGLHLVDIHRRDCARVHHGLGPVG